MKRIVLFASVGASVAAFFNGSLSDPAVWALVLAGVAGGGMIGGRPKPPIGIEN